MLEHAGEQTAAVAAAGNVSGSWHTSSDHLWKAPHGCRLALQNNPLPNWQDYAYDLTSRGSYKTASKAQLAVILQPKVPIAITENYEVLWSATEDYIPMPQILVKVVEALGEGRRWVVIDTRAPGSAVIIICGGC